MKTIEELLASDAQNGWKRDEHGYYMRFNEDIEVRIEPLLFGAAYVAVYDLAYGSLIGEKFPITIDTPARNRKG